GGNYGHALQELAAGGLPDGGVPGGLGDDEVGLAAGDVVLGQPVVDGDVVGLAALVGDAELLLLVHELLDVGEQFFAVHLVGEEQVVEQLGGGERPLILA